MDTTLRLLALVAALPGTPVDVWMRCNYIAYCQNPDQVLLLLGSRTEKS